MPLIKSKSDKAFKKNVATEVKAGKPVKQAVAIAYSTKRAAKKAYGGSVDDRDDYDAPQRKRYRPAPDARHYDSDIDYYESFGDGSDDAPEEPKIPSRVAKSEAHLKKKFFDKANKSASQFYVAKNAGDTEKMKKVQERWGRRNESEKLRYYAKNVPSMAEKSRKEWSEKIGKGKPAPFKSGGKVNW